ncbi:Uncharacterised protein [uncultured archaeon]|nr:Uncharacterised protein [uncultured archaeon]
MSIKNAILYTALFLFFIFPAQAQMPSTFTVYGQVFETDNTPVNGVTVSLSVSGGIISDVTTTATQTDGTTVNGYYYLDLANLPVSVSQGTPMTLTAATQGKSASTTVARAATDPQRVDLYLSTGAASPSPTATVSAINPSSGGGGGGGSGEPYDNILKKESKEEFMAKDLPTTYTFTTPELPVLEIGITGTTNAGMIPAQVELLKNLSGLVKKSAPGVVYKYVNIWVGTSGFAVPKNIKEATIKFKVDNSWLVSGSLKDTDIVILRWDGSMWNTLETRVITKDENFTYYQAKTNAFSPFAISSVKGLGMPTAVPTVEVTETRAKPTETLTPVPAATKKSPGFEDVLVVAVLLTLYILRRNRG